MPSGQAAAGGGSGGSVLGNAYYFLEDKYYALIDFLSEAGIPVGGFVDSFESRGIRTFPIAAVLLIAVVALAFWLSSPHVSTETDFVLNVFSGDTQLSKAVVQVYLGDELISSANTDDRGVATLEALPARALRFAVSAKGYAAQNRTFDLSARSKGSVELQCTGANCLQPTPAIHLQDPTPIVIITPIPTVVPTVQPSPSPVAPSPVSFSVYVKNDSSKLPIAGAFVEMHKSGTSRLLGNVTTDANGLALFERVEFGTTAYLVVGATGFLKYNGVVANQKVILDKDGKSVDLFLTSEIPSISLLATLFKVTDDAGSPVTARVDFFVNGSDTPYSSASVNGQGTFSFPAGTRILAIAYPSDPNFYAQGSVSFKAGDAVASTFLSRLIIDSTASSCEVVLSGTGPVSVAPGGRLPVTVKLSSRPVAPVTVNCGPNKAFATCSGNLCSTQCIFDFEGTQTISAFSGNTTCTSSRQVTVQQSLRSYSITANPGIIPLGAKTEIRVGFVDPSNPNPIISISCGEGAPVAASCGSSSGFCTALCGPYTTIGSKPIRAILGSEVVAAATVFVQGGPSCNLLLNPISPVEQQPVQVFVQFNYSQPVEGFLVQCGSNSQQLSCSGSSGICTGSCVFNAPGSYGIVASPISPSGATQPACAGTVLVNPFHLPANASFCGDAAHTPASSCGQSQPLYCTRFGTLESRASACGCPAGWRVSSTNPDFCEKLSARRVVGFANGTLSLGTLLNGKISGLSQVLGVRNASAAVFTIYNGTPTGAEALVSLVNGNLISAGVSSSGLIAGASFAVGVNTVGLPFLSPVTAGKVPSGTTKVLVVSGSLLLLQNTAADGSISSPDSVSSVAGATGGYLEVITLDGGPTACADGTAVGSCSAEKPFVCNSNGARSTKASVCGCPAGWMVSSTDANQCVPVQSTGVACSDGTPSGACSVAARPLKCDNGLLSPKAMQCGGCPLGFTQQGEQCIQSSSTKTICSDTTPVNSCSGFKPLFCAATGALSLDAVRCGCPVLSGKVFIVRGGQCVEAPPAVCADGRTTPGSCKVGDAPWFCGEDASSYSSLSSACGCPTIGGVAWVRDGERCIAPPNEFCPDGVTRRNTCKLDAQPLLCLNGASGYSDKASSCGCPSGYTQVGDSCLLFSTPPACSVDVFPKIVYPNQLVAASLTVAYTGFGGVSAGQVFASCDTLAGVSTPVNFDGRISAFSGVCSYLPVGLNPTNQRFYSARISTPAAFALCLATPPGNVVVLALPPTTCTDSFNGTATPAGSCVFGHAPFYCGINGTDFSGFYSQTVENVSSCGCPANRHASGGLCVSDSPAVNCTDGTSLNQCSGLGGQGKPFRCILPNAGDVYTTQLVPDAANCGCPANKVKTAVGNDCAVPSDGSLTVTVRGSIAKTTVAVFGNVTLANFNFPLLDHRADLYVQCGSSDDTGIGDLLLDRSLCVQRATGSVDCPFSCTYRAGENGSKVVSTNFTAGGKVFTSQSSPFLVTGQPGGSCSVTSDTTAAGLNLGHRANMTVSFSTPFDVNAVRQVFSGAGDGRYSFTCGNAFSPTTNSFAQIAPISTLNCVGTTGVCSATCEYLPERIDLNTTTSTTAIFTGFASTPYQFSCAAPLVNIIERPATVRVTVRHDGRPVAGADVSLFEKISGANRLCNTATSDANGTAVFTRCVSTTTGDRRSILSNSQVQASASLSVSGSGVSGATVSMVGSSVDTLLGLPSSLGANDVTVPIDFPSGTVGLSIIDALTRGVTANLSLASFNVSCPSVDLPVPPATPHLSSIVRAVGNCTGSVCDASSRAFMMNCFVTVSAPGYRSENYSQPVINSPDPLNPANRVSLNTVLVPLSFSGNSLYSIKEVYDLEGAMSDSHLPGVLSLEGLTLKKGFRYLVTNTLITVNATDRVGTFFQPSRGKESYILNNTDDLGLFYSPTNSIGHAYLDPSECGAGAINYFSPDGHANYYDWLELQAFNTRTGLASFAPTGTDLQFQILPNEYLSSNSSALRVRSFTYNRSLPSFVLDPFDSNAINSSKYTKLPYCGAKAKEVNYSLTDSVRRCSPDYQYCVESYFVQPGVSPQQRGDGFIAQSALKCGPQNADHCVPVLAEFTLTNNDLNLATPLVEDAYYLSFNTSLGSYEVKEVKLFGPAATARISRAGEVIVTRNNCPATSTCVTNLTAAGVVSSIVNNSFTINLKPIVALSAWGGLTTPIHGELNLTPLYPTPLDARVNTTISFSSFSSVTSSSKTAALTQWTLIAPRSGVRTVYGEIPGVPLVRQLEQADYAQLSFGYDQFVFAPFLNTSRFNASAYDCPADGSLKGYPCRPVELSFTAKAYQAFQNAQIFFNDSNSSFQIVSLQFNVSDSNGVIRPERSATVPASGSYFAYSFGALSQGESVSVLMIVKPPAGELPAVPVTIGLINASTPASSLNVTGFLASQKRYGLLRLQARDALDSRLLNGTVAANVRTGAASFLVFYAGRQQDNCVVAGDDSCVYRLKQLGPAWQAACPFASSLQGAGCLNASVPSGYFPADSVRLPGDSVGDIGQAVAGSIVAGAQNDLKVYALKPIASPSSVQRVEVRDAQGVLACQSNSDNASVPDCFTQAFALQRGVPYNITLLGSMKQSEKGGLYLSVGRDFSQARLLSVPTQISGSASVNVSVAGFSGATNSAATCSEFTQDASTLLSNGANSVQLLSNNSGLGDFPFRAEYSFAVPELYSQEFLTISFNSFVANHSLFGRELFFRTPADAALGFDFNGAKQWCQASTIDLRARPVDFSTHCDSLSCIHVEMKQGDGNPFGKPEGFRATSKLFWTTWNAAPYPQITYKFSVNIVNASASKSISFNVNPALVNLVGFHLTKFCGLGTDGRTGTFSADRSSFTLNANSCPDSSVLASTEDIAGEFTLEALPLNASAILALSYQGGSGRTDYASLMSIVQPEGIAQTTFATVTADVSQKQVTLAGDIPDRSTIHCSPTAGSCGSASFLSTFGNDCTTDGIDNTFSERGTPFCHASWLDFTYTLTSVPAAASANVSFQIVSGNAVIAPIPTSSISTKSSFIVRTVGGTQITSPLTPSSDGKSVSGSMSAIARGEQVRFTVRLNPRSSGLLNVVMKFYNGNYTELPLQFRVGGRAVQAIACPGPLCPDIISLNPCGRADLLVSVASSNAADLRVVPSCSNATLLVDPIFPADAIPLDFDNAFRSSCTGGSDPFAHEFWHFDPIPQSELPAGVRSLDGTYFTVDSARHAIIFDGLHMGANSNGQIVKGNNLVWPGTSAPIAAGTEIGRAKLVFSCGALGHSVAINVSLKANSLSTAGPNGEPISLLNPIDASGIFFQNQAHQLAWALYNGQFPQDVAVDAHAEGRIVTLPFNPDDRVKFFVTNQYDPHLGMAGSYPLKVYPKGDIRPPSASSLPTPIPVTASPLSVASLLSEPSCLKCDGECKTGAGAQSCAGSTAGDFTCPVVAGVCKKAVQVPSIAGSPNPCTVCDSSCFVGSGFCGGVTSSTSFACGVLNSACLKLSAAVTEVATSTSPTPTPVPTLSADAVLQAGGVVLQDAVHRPGNIMSGLVGDAHRDPDVNAAFRNFIDQANNPFPNSPSTCSSIDYVAKVYKTLPLAFKSLAKKIAYETAFRRTKKPDELLFCAFAKVDAPMYCNSAGSIVPNPSVCGCPYNFKKSADGSGCEPLNNALHPPTVCADGTAVNHCSKYKPYYCNEAKLLVANTALCGSPAPSSVAGKCYDGTPINSCLRQNARGFVCYGDTGSWKLNNIEIKTEVSECNACARVSAPYLPAYDYVPSVSLTVAGTVLGSTSTFKPGATVNNVFATVIEGNNVLVRSVLDFASLGVAAGSTPSVTVQYQRPGRIDCLSESAEWCSDSRLFESGSTPALSPSSPAGPYSKVFSAPDSDTGSAEGTWVLRAVVSYVDSSSVSHIVYSLPAQVVIARHSRACVDSASETEFSCTDTTANPWCDVSCTGGSKRVPIAAGPGVLSGEPNLWLNATPVEPFAVPNITNSERYAGAPYNRFINPQVQPFSLAFPLMTWSSQRLRDWNTSDTFRGYSLLNPPCSEGIGFYELQAKSRTGVNDWQYTAKLESLPLDNYLLNTEPSDRGNFDPSEPYAYVGGSTFGCQMHSEVPAYDFSQFSVDGRPAFWTPASSSDLLERHAKPLCNIRMQAVTAHSHACGGLCDCVNFNKERFGGNCGCALPGCGGVTAKVTLPTCTSASTQPNAAGSTSTLVCPSANCIEVANPLSPSQACACTDKLASCLGIVPISIPELQGPLGGQGYFCSMVRLGSSTYSCPSAVCQLSVTGSGALEQASCTCPTRAADNCLPIGSAAPSPSPGATAVPSQLFSCLAIKSVVGGFGQECNPGFCSLAVEPAGCTAGPIVISD